MEHIQLNDRITSCMVCGSRKPRAFRRLILLVLASLLLVSGCAHRAVLIPPLTVTPVQQVGPLEQPLTVFPFGEQLLPEREHPPALYLDQNCETSDGHALWVVSGSAQVWRRCQLVI